MHHRAKSCFTCLQGLFNLDAIINHSLKIFNSVVKFGLILVELKQCAKKLFSTL